MRHRWDGGEPMAQALHWQGTELVRRSPRWSGRISGDCLGGKAAGIVMSYMLDPCDHLLSFDILGIQVVTAWLAIAFPVPRVNMA